MDIDTEHGGDARMRRVRERPSMMEILQRRFKALTVVQGVDVGDGGDRRPEVRGRREETGLKGVEKEKRLNEQQRSRLRRLVELFHNIHPIFDSIASAHTYFLSARNPEYLLLKWELISLCYITDLCICYEELAISSGKRVVELHPHVLTRLTKETGKEGSPKRLVVLPVRSVGDDGMVKWKTRIGREVSTPGCVKDEGVPADADGRVGKLPDTLVMQMETRCLILEEEKVESDAVLELLCDHGEVIAELWQAYKKEDQRCSAEEIHKVLESLTMPPRVVLNTGSETTRYRGGEKWFGSKRLRKAMMLRYLEMAEGWEEETGCSGNEKGEEFARRMAREVFIGEGDGKERWVKGGSALVVNVPGEEEVREREGRMIPFVVWMCVMKVHGDRLSEEERANRA